MERGYNTFTSGFELLLGHADKNVKKKDLCLMEETLSGNRCREDSWSWSHEHKTTRGIQCPCGNLD